MLATDCKAFLDRMLEATRGRIRSKQAVEASILEMLRTHSQRQLVGGIEKSKFITWLKIRVSLYVMDAVRVGVFTFLGG